MLDYLLSNDNFSTMLIEKMLVTFNQKTEEKACIIIKEYEAITQKYLDSSNETKINIVCGLLKKDEVYGLMTLLRMNNDEKYTYIAFINPKGNNGKEILEDLNKDKMLNIVIYNQRMENKGLIIENPFKNKLKNFIEDSEKGSWSNEEFECLKEDIMEHCDNDCRVLFDMYNDNNNNNVNVEE